MNSAATWVGWVAEPDHGRGTFGILSTCLTTIFLCTWTAVHHDVPRAKQPAHITFLKKAGFMAGAILAPELVTAWSLHQYLRAKTLTAWMTQQNVPWTDHHSFCLIMGGFTYDFRTQTALRQRPGIETLTILDLETVVREGRADFAAVTKEYIMDKSKADGLTKVLACLQAFYLVVQVLGRVSEQLPVTSLEVSTVGYVPWTILSYYFWWSKPLDVTVPIQIPLRSVSDAASATTVIKNEGLSKQLGTIGNIASPETRRDWTVLGTFIIIAVAFGAFHVALWNAPIFASATEQTLWRATSLCMMTIPILEGCIVSFLARSGTQRPQSTFFNPSARSRKLSRRLDQYVEFFRIFIGFGAELILPVIFVAVRLCIIAEIFYGLHSLPTEIYADVNWGRFIPHVSLI